ncbi:hypothetical protein Asulf_00469 [Archaeoglobus sulfaticallidus PM70-1]|uniref:Uncharacterized protein n=1 Tax=Archaeoglobus sulfaticallidus PM70-1 TaxID=387631 RepID=N0BJ58_9EURY|nr:hypothetical protein [Archaeoglobus sulfaticallidus]AGK60496.1 hypothetical protein Asulf_00469 [Archaeoglobus sulfaticallidus PM70-1]
MRKLLIGMAVSLAITYFHWIGLIIGGLICGIFGSTKKAFASAIAFSIIVSVAFIVKMSMISLEKFFAMGMIAYLSFIIAFLLPLLSSSVVLLKSS